MPKGAPENITTTYLDYDIIDCCNSDGFVLKKPLENERYSYECHLGNYSSLKDAQKGAVHHFMIARPEKFSAQIFHRMNGTHTSHDYYQFTGVLKEEGIECPKELGCSSMSCVLTYDDEKI